MIKDIFYGAEVCPQERHARLVRFGVRNLCVGAKIGKANDASSGHLTWGRRKWEVTMNCV